MPTSMAGASGLLVQAAIADAGSFMAAPIIVAENAIGWSTGASASRYLA